MTTYPLAPLARVRRLREEAAAAEYAARERALAAARQETLAWRRALEEYLVWRRAEEDRRYLAILGREMARKEMDEFKAGVAALRDRDAALMEAAEAARRAEEEAAGLRDEAAENLKLSRKGQEKIDAHREIWAAAEAREAERREDLEMEEFTGPPRLEMAEDDHD